MAVIPFSDFLLSSIWPNITISIMEIILAKCKDLRSSCQTKINLDLLQAGAGKLFASAEHLDPIYIIYKTGSLRSNSRLVLV